MNSEEDAKRLAYSFTADIALGALYIGIFYFVISLEHDELTRFYIFLAFILTISALHAAICCCIGISPVLNSYFSISVATIGLCLLVSVTESEKKKVRLLHLYEPTARSLQNAKNQLNYFSIATENKHDIREHILERSKDLPSEYEITKYNCTTIPKHSLSSYDPYRMNDIGVYDDTPTLRDFVDETHCTETVITVQREPLDESMSLRAMIEKNRHGSYEFDGRRYPLSLLLPYIEIAPNSDRWKNTKERLEDALEAASLAIKKLEDEYQKIGSEIARDAQDDNWETKSFYLSWWNFFLIIALGYQLNSVIINRN